MLASRTAFCYNTAAISCKLTDDPLWSICKTYNEAQIGILLVEICKLFPCYLTAFALNDSSAHSCCDTTDAASRSFCHRFVNELGSLVHPYSLYVSQICKRCKTVDLWHKCWRVEQHFATTQCTQVTSHKSTSAARWIICDRFLDLHSSVLMQYSLHVSRNDCSRVSDV